MINISNNIDKENKENNSFYFLSEYTSFEEIQSPISSFIEKNDNKKDIIIIKNPEKTLEINQNFSKVETNDTNKFIKKKRKKDDKENKEDKDDTEDNNNNKKTNSSINNFRRTIKTHIFKVILEFYNKKIEMALKGEINFGIDSKKIKDINKEEKENMNELSLNKTMKDIFSGDLSIKFCSHKPYHNREIIDELLNEGDGKEEFNKLFNKTLKECIIHLRGEKNIEGLEGLEKDFNEYINNKKFFQCLDENGKKKFFDILYKIENYFNNKKKRKNK